MKSAIASPLSEFLARADIETSPAWEFIDGRAVPKPMPTLFHSRLQRNLVNYINLHTEMFEAVQEWRCVVSSYSPVPDISVILTSRLPEEDGPLNGSPDWLIEIRSPDQSTLDLQNKILHCLDRDTQLAWLIDITQKRVWVWQGNNLPNIYSDTDVVPSLGDVPQLTVNAVMAMCDR